MEPLPKELQDNQYYVSVLDALIVERNISIKHRLQKADTYAQFLNEQAGKLMDETIEIIRLDEVSFLEASNSALESWKQRMFA